MDMSAMPSSSRILYDVPCVVCRDHSSGKHYGVYACDGCAGFFKRSVRRQRSYTCKARSPGRCLVDKTHRNQCRSCRLDKCMDVGMNKDAVQHERGPRNSTIRRQMALYINDRTPSTMPARETSVPKEAFLPPPAPLSIFNPYLLRLGFLSPQFLPFFSSSPSTAPPSGVFITDDPGALCEAAAKLLFMNVKWSKGVTVFESLSITDRLCLLADTWKDLFVLGAAQFLYPLNVKVLINSNNDFIEQRNIDLFVYALAEIAKLSPNATEYTCLRGIMLFNTSFDDGTEKKSRPSEITECKNLQELNVVAAEQHRNKMILNEYAVLSHPLEASRPSQLLQLLPIIRQVSSETIVDLFFRTTIQNISIERIICDMYKTA